MSEERVARLRIRRSAEKSMKNLLSKIKKMDDNDITLTFFEPKNNEIFIKLYAEFIKIKMLGEINKIKKFHIAQYVEFIHKRLKSLFNEKVKNPKKFKNNFLEFEKMIKDSDIDKFYDWLNKQMKKNEKPQDEGTLTLYAWMREFDKKSISYNVSSLLRSGQNYSELLKGAKGGKYLKQKITEYLVSSGLSRKAARKLVRNMFHEVKDSTLKNVEQMMIPRETYKKNRVVISGEKRGESRGR